MALDDQDRTVELQHFDGTIEELDLESWFATDMERAQAPEDWSGSVDITFEDLPERDTGPNQDWRQALELMDSFE